MTGDLIPAAEAERIGLVNHVTPNDKVLDEALAFATWLKGSLGYSEGPIAEFERLLSLKPQHYYLRGYFADVLAANGQYGGKHPAPLCWCGGTKAVDSLPC